MSEKPWESDPDWIKYHLALCWGCNYCFTDYMGHGKDHRIECDEYNFPQKLRLRKCVRYSKYIHDSEGF